VPEVPEVPDVPDVPDDPELLSAGSSPTHAINEIANVALTTTNEPTSPWVMRFDIRAG
jgi:hypothetical protein